MVWEQVNVTGFRSLENGLQQMEQEVKSTLAGGRGIFLSNRESSNNCNNQELISLNVNYVTINMREREWGSERENNKSKERKCRWKCEGSMLCFWSFSGGNIPSSPVIPTRLLIEHMILVSFMILVSHVLVLHVPSSSRCLMCSRIEKCRKRPEESERIQIFEDIYGITNLNWWVERAWASRKCEFWHDTHFEDVGISLLE